MSRRLVDTTPDAPAPLGSRRSQVLATLRAAPRPLGVQEVADATGLHANTARFHLDGLVSTGLAQRSLESRTTPGRRRVVYAAPAAEPASRSYGLLAEMLSGLVVTMNGAGEPALEAGRAWGRHLVERGLPSQRLSADDSLARVGRLLDDVGFEPEVLPEDDGATIALHHCPFREVAAQHEDVVCSIHLGLMQGALAELGAPWAATELRPFVSPGLCVAHLRARGPRT